MPERTTDHGQTTGKLYHLRLQVTYMYINPVLLMYKGEPLISIFYFKMPLLVRKFIDVNEHERLSNFTLIVQVDEHVYNVT